MQYTPDRLESSDAVSIVISPRAGMTNMSGSSYYDTKARYSAGLDIGVPVGNYLTLEGGYFRSEIGILGNNSNPWVTYANSYYPGNQSETVVMKQDLFELGLKLHFLGPESRIRPFIGLGGAYAKGYVNYDQRIIDTWRQFGYPGSTDYQSSSYLGYVSAGLDVRITKMISVGAQFKYYNVFSSSENNGFYNPSLYGPYGNTAGYAGGYGGAGYNPYGGGYGNTNAPGSPDWDKRAIGGTLASSSFYSFLLGLNFSL